MRSLTFFKKRKLFLLFRDAIIDDLKERLGSKQNEIDHLRQKLQSVEMQSRSVPQQEYLNYNYDRVR